MIPKTAIENFDHLAGRCDALQACLVALIRRSPVRDAMIAAIDEVASEDLNASVDVARASGLRMSPHYLAGHSLVLDALRKEASR